MHKLVTEGRRILHKKQKYYFHFTPSCPAFPSRIADEPRKNEANLQQSQLAKHCRIISKSSQKSNHTTLVKSERSRPGTSRLICPFALILLRKSISGEKNPTVNLFLLERQPVLQYKVFTYSFPNRIGYRKII